MIVRAAIVAMSLLLSWGAASAQERTQPLLDTNEHEIEAVRQGSNLSIDDGLAVFAFVLGSLPGRVKVLPTENYYYFRFFHKGVRYVGNIRLAASDRDQGKVQFSYSEEPTDWNSEPDDRHGAFGASEGVSVEKVGELEYRVTAGDKSVIFALNDLSDLKPPAQLLTSDEKYLGPVFDESGVRFFLVFNQRLKVFHFLLDETETVPDQFSESKAARPVLIGKRTGFAFYPSGDRKILVGVNERQSRLNTYLDGPFDQLPENFIHGEALRDAMVASEPAVKGQIDRLGNFSSGGARFLIHPYMLYREESDLAVFQRCITSRSVRSADRPLCFVIGDEEAQSRKPLPRALKRR